MTRLAVLILAVAALGTTLYEAASPQQDRLGAATAPESGYEALDGSGRLSEALATRPTSEEEAGVPSAPVAASPLPPGPNPEPLGLGNRAAHRTGSALEPPLAPARSTSCESPCAVDVAEWDQPTPEPLWTFNGLHPIAESWSVGVASGKASHVGAGFPSWYLALPIGPGFRVRIVGPGGEVTRVSTDAGPALHLQRPPDNRIADLSVTDFVHVCGVPSSFGLCLVSVSVIGRVR